MNGRRWQTAQLVDVPADDAVEEDAAAELAAAMHERVLVQWEVYWLTSAAWLSSGCGSAAVLSQVAARIAVLEWVQRPRTCRTTTACSLLTPFSAGAAGRWSRWLA